METRQDFLVYFIEVFDPPLALLLVDQNDSVGGQRNHTHLVPLQHARAVQHEQWFLAFVASLTIESGRRCADEKPIEAKRLRGLTQGSCEVRERWDGLLVHPEQWPQKGVRELVAQVGATKVRTLNHAQMPCVLAELGHGNEKRESYLPDEMPKVCSVREWRVNQCMQPLQSNVPLWQRVFDYEGRPGEPTQVVPFPRTGLPP
mmetsp:Transcript_25378/g.70625  ORF Transcript_25378/g.70625 Transcript_25378/m.70625 type:complete len:203 (-) Transcript_25378:662-1270(-)